MFNYANMLVLKVTRDCNLRCKYCYLADKDEYKEVKFLDINAENSPEARKLAGVSNLPFFAVFKDGQLVASDFTSKEEAVDKLIQKII